VIFGIEGLGISSREFLDALQERGVLAVPLDPGHVRMVTHLDVSRADVDRAADTLGELAKELMS
jgi:threonine aldolase